MAEAEVSKYNQGKRKFHKDRGKAQRPQKIVVQGKSILADRIEVNPNQPLLELLVPEGLTFIKAEIFIREFLQVLEPEPEFVLSYSEPTVDTPPRGTKLKARAGYQVLELPATKAPVPMLLSVTVNFTACVWYTLTYRY